MPVLPLLKRTGAWLTDQIIARQLDSPLGYVLMIALGVCVAFLVSLLGKASVILPILFVAIPAAAACLFYMDIGIAVSIFTAFMIGLASKLAEGVPFGIALDALLFLMFFGLLIRQIVERDFSFAKNSVSFYIFLWVIYNLLSIFNPWAGSQMAWIFTVRSMAGLTLMFYVASYAFKDKKTIFRMIKLIIGLAFISALYGMKQEFMGFTDWEMRWLSADEERMQLIYQWSRIRVFSFFSDPTNFGILMCYMSTFCLVLITGPFKLWKKAILGVAAICMIMSMAYAGSRTPFVLMPFGLFIFVLLKMDKKVLMATGIVSMVAFVVIMKGHNNAVLFRIQSAFILSKSADTMDVRLKNQKMIQPFIQSHPVGGGLGSTGVWGKRFTPNSLLSQFAHDSGFVRIAVELGWIGLILYCLLLLTILKTSIYYYFRVKNPKIKVIYLGLTVIFFQLTLANYPQEAIVILPTSVNFYIFLAVLVRLKDYDDPLPVEKKKNFGNYAKDFIGVEGIPIDKKMEAPDLSKTQGGKRSKARPFGIELEHKKGDIWGKR